MQPDMLALLTNSEGTDVTDWNHTRSVILLCEILHAHLETRSRRFRRPDSRQIQIGESGNLARIDHSDAKCCVVEDMLWMLKAVGVDFNRPKKWMARGDQNIYSLQFRSTRLAAPYRARRHGTDNIRQMVLDGRTWIEQAVGPTAQDLLEVLLRRFACMWEACNRGLPALQNCIRLHAQWGVGEQSLLVQCAGSFASFAQKPISASRHAVGQ
jgi:hypothetical protein